LIYGEQTTFEPVFDPEGKNSLPPAFEEARIRLAMPPGAVAAFPAPGTFPPRRVFSCSGSDVRVAPRGKIAIQTSNPKLHQQQF